MIDPKTIVMKSGSKWHYEKGAKTSCGLQVADYGELPFEERCRVSELEETQLCSACFFPSLDTDEEMVLDKAELEDLRGEIKQGHELLTEIGVGKEHWSIAGRIDHLLTLMATEMSSIELLKICLERGIIPVSLFGDSIQARYDEIFGIEK